MAKLWYGILQLNSNLWSARTSSCFVLTQTVTISLELTLADRLDSCVPSQNELYHTATWLVQLNSTDNA